MNAPQPDPIVLKRAKAYLAKMQAIQGPDHSVGVAAARAVILGFDLGREAGVALLKSDYAGRCSPPLSDQQVDDIASRAINPRENKPVGWLLRASTGPSGGLSDLGNAQYFVKHFGDDVRYCREWDCWFLWDGSRWRKDRTGGIVRKVIDSLRKHQASAIRGTLSDAARKKLILHLLRSEAAPRIKAILELAQNLEPVPIVPEQFDVDSWKLNCVNGTIELRSGILRGHRREDLITKIVPFESEPAAGCPQWMKFLDKVMAGNKAVIEFIQRLVGYSLTGVVTEHCMAILYGEGRNGKSTFIETVRFVLNDYAIEAAPGLLVEQRNANHPTEIADLHGARFVSNSEVGQGHKLDEAKFKRLTGGDRLKARKMYQDFYEFYPTHKLWMCTNHTPVIRETKEAMWRRLFLVPFQVVIPDAEVDKSLAEKLKSEAPGILNWMLQGCRAWQAQGLKPPDDVLRATSAYREEMDLVGQFISERCVIDKAATIGATALYQDFENWYEQQGIASFSQKRFGTYLKSQPHLKHTRETGGKAQYEGIRLRTAGDPSPAVDPSTRHDPRAVTAEEFQTAKCVYEDGDSPTIEIEAKRLYDAYFDFCEKLRRPPISMAEIDAFYEELGFQKLIPEEGGSFFRGIGLQCDFPDIEASEPLAANVGPTTSCRPRVDDDPSDPSASLKPPPQSEQAFGELIE